MQSSSCSCALPQCAGTQEKSPFAPTPFINMYVFWMVCMALCSHWLMLSVNCLQIRQCCGSSPRTLETRLETAQLSFFFPFLPLPRPPSLLLCSFLFKWTSPPHPWPLPFLLCCTPFSFYPSLFSSHAVVSKKRQGAGQVHFCHKKWQKHKKRVDISKCCLIIIH